jgi:secreted trypsin-like serine protease
MKLRSMAGALATGAVLLASVFAPAPAAAAPPSSGGLQPNIVGGTAAPAYTFMASLQTLAGGHTCGASVVHANWAVTARHCVAGVMPATRQLRVGSANRTAGGVVVAVTAIFTHATDDIALLQIAAVPAAYTPIVIATTSGPVGTFTRIMGWGQTCPNPGACGAPVPLQQLNTSIVADGGCIGIIAANEICTSNPGGIAGACYGDSGGPQIKSVNGRWQLIGETSRSGGGAICATAPSIYVDVPVFRPWIQATTGLPL